MKKADREMMYKQIKTHGLNLLEIFPNAIEQDPIKLCKKLHRIERKAHRRATDYCNGTYQDNEDGTQMELDDQKQINSINKILSNDQSKLEILINWDPRGYALKISTKQAESLNIYKDWGGYGIIAPDFTPEA
jgi:hypothetical protein